MTNIVAISGTTITIDVAASTAVTNATVYGQHGIRINNRGVIVSRVDVRSCGGHGILLTDSVFSKLYDVQSSKNVLDGWNIDDAPTTNTTGSVNFNVLTGCAAGGNTRDGIRVVHGEGISAFGWDAENNTGAGIRLLGTGGVRPAYGCRFLAAWDENNSDGSVIFGAGSRYCVVDFIRYSSTDPNDSGTANSVWAVSTSGAVTMLHRFAVFGENRFGAGNVGGASVTIDTTAGGFQEATITANITGTPGLSFSGGRDGQRFTLALIQGTGGPYTVSSWASNIQFTGGTPPTLSNTVGRRDILTFYYNKDAANWYQLAQMLNVG